MDRKNLITLLEWDSKFFGFPIGRINKNNINESDYFEIETFSRKNKLRLLQFQCDVNDPISILTAESLGFHFADYRVNYLMEIQDKEILELHLSDEFCVRHAYEADSLALQNIAGSTYRSSRYYFDLNFPRDKVDEFYKNWVSKSVIGLFDDLTLVFEYKNIVIGFICITICEHTARFTLVGMHEKYSNKGLGKIFFKQAINMLKKKRLRYIKTITQGRNIIAQNFYNKVGFKIEHVEIYYHLWITQ